MGLTIFTLLDISDQRWKLRGDSLLQKTYEILPKQKDFWGFSYKTKEFYKRCTRFSFLFSSAVLFSKRREALLSFKFNTFSSKINFCCFSCYVIDWFKFAVVCR